MSTTQRRIRMADELWARLDDHAAVTLRDANAIIETAVAEYLAACLNLANSVSQSETAARLKMDQAAEAVAPQDVTAAPHNPYKGALPTDTDEILALVSDFNAIHLAEYVGSDLWDVYATRKQEIGRHIERARAELQLSR